MTAERAMHPRVRRGFTLLELLVSVTLAVVLLGAMAWFVSDLVDTRDRLAAASARDGAATAIIERIEGDLAFAVTADAGLSGVRGDATSITILTRGVLLADASARLGDLQRHEYRFDPSLRSLTASRAEVVAGSPSPGAAHTVLDAQVERVRLRYHDGSAWHDEFDSRRDGGLPTLVEIAFWWAPRRAAPTAGDDLNAELALGDDDRADEFADFGADESGDEWGGGDEEGAAEAVREPDRIRVIRIPDARPVDPDAAIIEDDGTAPSGGDLS